MRVKLFGDCLCGKAITAKGDLPQIEFNDGNKSWKGYPAEHLVILCPQCGRLVNLT